MLLSAFSSLHGVFHSTAFVVARNLAVFLALVFWLALAFWVFKDARRRIDDPWLVGVATLLGLAPPYVGPVVYLLFRPAETLEDVKARRAELRALEEHLGRRQPTCPHCAAAVEADYLVCPVCTTQLRYACSGCGAPLEPLWQACPYCTRPLTATDLDVDAALTAEARMLAADTGPGLANLREPRPAES
jgi:RNA polymerase subunit RPABC4/transcription elongation factor Spt4